MKKTVFTLNVDEYAPEITALTYPLIEAYSDKIGASFHIIGKRKFPEWPVTYEKLQIYQLAQEMGNDWNIYIDSDALIHPDTPDLTRLLPRDTVAHFAKDCAPVRWRSDKYFERDGRHFGTGNWLTVASDLCLDLWRPLDDLTPKQAIANIFPTVLEMVSGVVNHAHLIDDYALSRNIARFGLKATTFREIFSKLGYKEVRDAAGRVIQNEGGYFFYHQYLFPINKKVVEMRKVLRSWKVVEIMGYDFPETAVDKAEKIQGFMTRAELEWLYEKAQGMESVVEIGCFKGRSTFVLASACNGDRGKVFAIDPFIFGGDWSKFINAGLGLKAGDDYIGDFLKNCGHFPHLTVIKKPSIEVAASNLVPPEVDMVFIDGDHSYEAVRADLKAWAPRTKKLICGHDFNDPMYPGVKRAVYEFFGADSIKTGPGSLWSAYADDIE